MAPRSRISCPSMMSSARPLPAARNTASPRRAASPRVFLGRHIAGAALVQGKRVEHVLLAGRPAHALRQAFAPGLPDQQRADGVQPADAVQIPAHALAAGGAGHGSRRRSTSPGWASASTLQSPATWHTPPSLRKGAAPGTWVGMGHREDTPMQNVSAIIYAAAFHSRGITGARQGPAVIPGTALAAFCRDPALLPYNRGHARSRPYAALPARSPDLNSARACPPFKTSPGRPAPARPTPTCWAAPAPDKAPASPGCWARTCRKPAADAPAAPGRTARARP